MPVRLTRNGLAADRRPGTPPDSAPRVLVLLRHAKAEDGDGRADVERRLTPHGVLQASRLGVLLAAGAIRPGLMLSSPASRAMTTARLVAPALGYAADRVEAEPRVYEAEAAGLLRVLHEQGGRHACVVVAGHNPGLSDLASLLTRRAVALQTAQAAVLAFRGPWESLAPATASLEALVGPG